MKKKTKIAISATAVAITYLMITAYHPEPVSSPVSPQTATVSEVVAIGRTYTPPMVTEPIVAEEIAESSTQAEEITEPTHRQGVWYVNTISDRNYRVLALNSIGLR